MTILFFCANIENIFQFYAIFMESQNEGLIIANLLNKIQKLGLDISDINSQLSIKNAKNKTEITNAQRISFYKEIIQDYEDNNDLTKSLWSKLASCVANGRHIYES